MSAWMRWYFRENFMIQLSSLIIYPVKSCRGIALETSVYGPDGLRHDREYLVVDAAGRFLTQRALPRMAVIETASSEDALILRAPGLGELRVPWQPSPEEMLAESPVTIWRDTVQAADAGDESAAWLSRVLEQPCRLVRRGPSYARFLPGKRVPGTLATREVPVSFADAFPMLVISEESLADLNGRLDHPLPMDRFRPNLVLRGCSEPYAEDTWSVFRVGERATLHAGGACERCNVPTIDQQTGTPQGKEPLRTLALYRRSKEGNGVVFGQNVVPESHGELRVGDPVEIVAR